MPTPKINPLAFNPRGPFDRMHAYLMATWAREIYHPPWAFGETTLKTVMGADTMTTLESQDFGVILNLSLRAQIVRAAWGAASMLRGSTTFIPQIAQEVAASNLVDGAPVWAGKVAQYFLTSAAITGAALAPHIIQPWLSAGHSLGGAVAGLVSRGASQWSLPEAYLTFTMAAPREGNYTYATSRNDAARLRLENQGDPITTLPVAGSGNPFDDAIILPGGRISLGGAYLPWGVNHHLWEDGTITLPPALIRGSGEEFVENVMNGLQTGALFDFHYAPIYALRIRRGIPVAFPVTVDNLAWPGLFELDTLNVQMNNTDVVAEEMTPEAREEWNAVDGEVFRRTANIIGPKEPPDLVSFLCE